MDENILVAVVNSMGGNLNDPGILYIIKSGEPGEPVETGQCVVRESRRHDPLVTSLSAPQRRKQQHVSLACGAALTRTLVELLRKWVRYEPPTEDHPRHAADLSSGYVELRRQSTRLVGERSCSV
jgi:hypothetical protein